MFAGYGKMMTNEFYSLKEYFDHQGIFFCFTGPISQNLVAEMAGLLKQKMSMQNANKMAILRVFAVVVESAQNILRYSAEKINQDPFSGQVQELRVGIIAVGYEQGKFFVVTGNMVENASIENLRTRLTHLQTLNAEELKAWYLDQRKSAVPSDSKGAGLGLIEMARKASQPLTFEFKTLDVHRSFFWLKITI
jgi:hypothetical protein